jgi:hypothetical protein
MAQQWQFKQDEQQQWHWTRVEENHDTVESATAFPTPLDCYLDAVRHAVDHRRSLLDTTHELTADRPDSQTH